MAVKNPRNIEFQDLAIKGACTMFARFLGVDSVPIIWNANIYKSVQEQHARTYPIIYLKQRGMRKVDYYGNKKVSNTLNYGVKVQDGTARTAIRFTPIIIAMEFSIIVDTPQMASDFIARLIVGSETHSIAKHLAFAIANPKLGDNFNISSQMVIISRDYEIEDVEYSESEAMQYRIYGQLELHTKATLGGLDPEIIPNFLVIPNVNANSATQNDDGTTSPLSHHDNKPFPVSISFDGDKP